MKILSEEDSAIKKLDFTKETINNIQIDFDGKLEDILSGPIWKSIRENNRIFMERYDLHLQGCIN